jgi:hypothetical protein
MTTDKYPVSIMNALRRTVISRIPVWSFNSTDITIHKNTSILDNDRLKHRLTGLPAKQNHSDILLEINFQNNTDKDIMYSTNDISGLISGINIIKLRPNTQICVTMKRSIGCGVDNAMFSPVTNVVLKQSRKVMFNDHPITPEDLYKFDLSRIPSLKNIDYCNWVDLNIIDNINEIIRTENPSSSDIVTIIDMPIFTFSFESIVDLSGSQIFKKAIEILKNGLNAEHIDDHSIANMITHKYFTEYTSENSKKTLHIQKNHPTQRLFDVTSSSKQNIIKVEIKQCIKELNESLDNLQSSFEPLVDY